MSSRLCFCLVPSLLSPLISYPISREINPRSRLLRALFSAAAVLLILAGFLRPAAAQTSAPLVTFMPGTESTPFTGFTDPEGVAIDSSGNLYITDSAGYAPPSYLYKETLSGGTYTQSVIASGFTIAWGVALDSSGNVYVADYGNEGSGPSGSAVYKETLSGGSYTQTKIASGFIDADGVAVDSSGNVYVADFGCPLGCSPAVSGALYKETLSGGSYTQTKIASGLDVSGVSVDSSGNLYISVWTNPGVTGAVYKETLSGGSYTQSTVASNFITPESVTVTPSGILYVADDHNLGGSGSGIVYQETPQAGGSYSQSELVTGLASPEDVALAGNGDLYIADITTVTGGVNPVAGAVYKEDYADPPSLSFGSVNVGSTSSAQTVTVNNIGNAALDFEVPSSGNNPSIASGFTLASGGSGECPLVTSISSTEGVLASGASCTLPVTFAPQASGSYSGSTLVLTDNNLNAAPYTTQTIPLSGTGTGADKASYFTVTGSSPVTAGTQTSITVRVYDALGNLTTGYTGTVHFTSSDGSAVLPANSTLSSGVGTFNVTLKTAGSQTVTATDTTTSSVTGSVAIAVNAGAATRLAVSAPSSATAGTSFGITVYTYDAYGNFANTYGGTVHFTSTDSAATLPANSALSSGQGSFTATLHTAGNQTITAADTSSSSITGTSNAISVNQAPAITSARSTAFTVGTLGSFTVTATGSPSPTFSESGALPTGLTFTSNGTLSGTPAAATGGSYPITITASNSVSPNATQNFTLTVDQSPAISGPSSTIFIAGAPGSFTAVASGYPAPTFSETGALPSGITLASNGTLAGTPAAGAGGSYPITITASNGVGSNATQNFTLTVDQSPVITSTNSATFTVGTAGSFTVTGAGYPAPTFSETGALPSGITLNSNGALSGTPASGTAGTYPLSITASNAVSPNAMQSFTLTINPPPYLVVTSPGDDSGTASNCTVQASTTTGTDSSCSLRDALLEAASLTGGNIYFDTAKFASATTITLTNGTLSISSNTTIHGLTATVSGVTTNPVTVAGGGSSSNFSVFTVNSGTTRAAIANLTIANGHINTQGGAINNLGSLAVTDCTFSNNYAAGYAGSGNGGGAIYNDGTLTITGSTFSGNSAAPGGAIDVDSGQVTIENSTFSGNSAFDSRAGGAIFINTSAGVTVGDSTFSGNSATGGGGIYNYGTLTASNTILAGNAGGDCGAGGSGLCPSNGSSGNVVGVGTTSLAPLGSYGGTTQTMIPLPGSPAICAGLQANIPSGVTTDQRGQPNTNTTYAGYNAGTPCVDSGAVQTNYSLSFSTEPAPISPAAAIYQNANFEAGATLDESGSPFTGSAVSIPLSLSGSGSLSNNTTTTASGVATYSTLQVSAAGTNDQLMATLALNPAISSTSPAISVASSSFDVTATSAPSVTSANAATFNLGSAGTFTVTTSGSPTPSLSENGALPGGVTFTDNGDGTATLSGTPAAGTSGSYSIAITANNGISPNGTQSFTLTVDQAPAITSASSTTFTTGTSGSFTATTTGNPKATLSESGALPSGVTFINNSNGTATLSGTPAAGSGGSYPLAITASNGVGSTATQNFTLTVDQAPAIISGNSTTFTAGAPAAFTIATSSYPAASLSESGPLPSGVTFTDNGNGTATVSGTPAKGTAGTYALIITAGNGVGTNATQSFVLTVIPPPSFVVTTTADDTTGSASNCTSGGGPNCSLRDALAASVAIGGQINFSPAVFSAGNTASQNTITLGSGGTLTIPSNTGVTGLTAGSGAALMNLVTVAGGGSSSNFSVFTVGAGVTGAAISNLTVSNGNSNNDGGGIDNQGILTVLNCTFSANHATVGGAGIWNRNGAALGVMNSTFSANSAGTGGRDHQLRHRGGGRRHLSGNSAGTAGSAILDYGTLTLAGTTISANNAAGAGGGIAEYGTLTVANSILAGNTGGDCLRAEAFAPQTVAMAILSA